MVNSAEISVLQNLSTLELKKVYEEIIGAPPPAKSRRDFILGNICWAKQAYQSNKPEKLRNKLIKFTSNISPIKVKYKLGTRLVREWHGTTHEVLVADDGFL